MISDSEKRKANEYLDRKKLRLQQVREQSKNIAKNIRSRVKEEKNKQLNSIAAVKTKEFENVKRKTIEKLQQDHERCLCQIGTSHTAASEEVAAEQEWKCRKEFNKKKTAARGSTAAGVLQKTKKQQELEAHNVTQRRNTARSISNRTASNIRKKSLPTRKIQTAEKKIQHYYSENDEPDDNDCSNLTENFEVTQVPHLSTLPENIAGPFRKQNEESAKSSSGNRSKQTSIAISLRKNNTPVSQTGLSHEENDSSHSDGESSGAYAMSNRYGSQWNTADRDDRFTSVDPSLYRVNPVETLRQIANENRLMQESVPDYNLNTFDEVPTSLPRNLSQRLHLNSNDNPLNTVSQYIQSRNVANNNTCPAYNKATLATETVCNPSECAARRDIINHARIAPYTDVAPIIPTLPEHYVRQKADTVQRDFIANTARKKNTELFAADDHWLPKSPETDDVKRKYTALSPRLYNQHAIERGGSKPLRGILAKCMSSVNVRRDVKHINNNRNDTRSRPTQAWESARSVNCYDQANKFAKNVTFDSRKLVERTPKRGIDAYRSAKEEDSGVDRLITDVKLCRNITASRLRGENALEKMRFNNEIKKMKREIEQLKNERRMRTRLPETIYIEECPRDHDKYRRKIEEVRLKADKTSSESVLEQKPKSPIKDTPLKSSSKEKHITNSDPVNELPKRERTDNTFLTDDLDKIPTRESESSSRSTTVESIAVITPERVKHLDPEELFQLVQRQKRKVMKEVAMIGIPNKNFRPPENPKKVLPESKSSLKDDSSYSTLEEAPPKVVNKRFTKRVSTTSPKGKIMPDKLQNKGDDDKTVVDKSNLHKEASGTTSSVSFEGLKIVVQIKRDNKKLGKEPSKPVGYTDNRLLENVREDIDSSNGVSIKTSKYMSKKELRLAESAKYNTSESTTYMSPPEKITTHFEKLLNQKFRTCSSEVHSRDISPPPVDPECNVQNWMTAAEDQNKQYGKDIMTGERSLDHRVTQTTEVSTFSQHNKETRVESKGVQVKISNEVYKSAVSVGGENVSKSSTINGDPVLKRYIRQLLEMSKNGVDSLGINISDTSTPGSSIINVTTNMAVNQNNSVFHEKVDKLRHFIQENYTLLDELGKENIFSSSGNGGSRIRDRFRASSDDILSSLAATSTENIHKSNICQVLPQGSGKTLAHNKVQPAGLSESEPSLKKSQVVSAKPKEPAMINPTNRNTKQKTENFPLAKSKIPPQIGSKDSASNANVGDTVSDQSVSKKGFVYFNTEDSGSGIITPVLPLPPPDIPDSRSIIEGTELKIPENAADIEVDNDLNTDVGEIPTNNNANNIKIAESILSRQSNSEIEECTQRISNLSEMLIQVRKDKEAMLSSTNSPFSEEKATELSQKLSSNTSSESEKNTTTDVPFVPMFGDIPKPQSIDVARNSQIDQLRSEILSISEGTDTFVPVVWDYKPIPASIKSLSISAIPCNEQIILFENFENCKLQHLYGRPKPPVALGRHPIMRNNNVDPGTPHELSTIAEVDTPITARNASVQSKIVELSPSSIVSVIPLEIGETKSPRDEDKKELVDFQDGNATGNLDVPSTPVSTNIKGQQNVVNISIPGKNRVDVRVGFEPFISFNEYVMQKYPDDLNLEITLDASTLKPENVEDLDLSSSDETLPDIIPELLKRNLIKKPFSSQNSTTHGSAEESSSSSKSASVFLALSPSKSPLKDSQTQKKEHDPSISGVRPLQKTSSDSDGSSDLKADLKAVGMDWAIALLKRTEKAYRLSSGSSSPKRKHPQEERKRVKISGDPGGASDASIGLSTLLDDLNLSENFCKDYSAGNIFKSSIHRDLEMLFNKIENKKGKSVNSDKSLKFLSPFTTQTVEDLLSDKKVDEKSAKFSEATARVDIQSKPDNDEGSKDKTHQRTSTPVLSAHKSPSFSSNVTSSSQGASKCLFGIESDLSSVRNLSNSDRNFSLDDKDSLSIPNISLKFGKLFDSTTLSDK